MKPIKYELNETPILYAEEDEIVQGYKMEKWYGFCPEFLEGISKNNNDIIEKWYKKKKELAYIGTVRIREKGIANEDLEYYYCDDRIIAYLVEAPTNKKYYPALTCVAVFVRKDEVC